MKLETYFAYLAICSAAVVVPGPSNALIAANAMKHGTRAGLLNVAGTQAGVGLMLVAVTFSFISIVNALGHWFEWIKLAGAVYLIVVGILLFRSADTFTLSSPGKAPVTGFFIQGFAVSLSNPKQLLFFGALLPQFIDSAADRVGQMVTLGATAMAIAAISDSTYAFVAGRIGKRVDAKHTKIACRVGGLSLAGAGVWLALSKAKS
jgi:threonine/homoserine/homoserine lactone efflux protein